jgi:superfamily I DNA and RNA helicase
MKINSRERAYSSNAQVFSLINYLNSNEGDLDLIESNLYFDFPVFKDFDGDLILTQVLILSIKHGIILISFSDESEAKAIAKNESLLKSIEQLHSTIFSRLLRNRVLRGSKTELSFPINSIIYNDKLSHDSEVQEITCISNFSGLKTFLKGIKTKAINSELYLELVSTIEGAKGMMKPKERPNTEDKLKGYVVTQIEKEINSFDEYQKRGFVNEIQGPERIRGLAGSGKTVVLALKAAITHLRYPDAAIVYTFYTKSLYQHIQRLITRFYRQYDDRDPDWNKLKIIHAWGNSSNSGVYYEACEANQLPFLSLDIAKIRDPRSPFGYACDELLKKPIEKLYDFIFIDEGQDFPETFIKLCLRLCRKGRIVWAYDELQTIFQAKTPKIESVLSGTDYVGLEQDIILYKCYRNPREVLVTAHAIGFGIYGPKIVQMIEGKEYWSDIGYKVVEGNFKEGQKMVIERPKENSLEVISDHFKKDDIIKFKANADYESEIQYCVENIINDIELGLLPEDILVVVVDDRNAKEYLYDIQKELAKVKIKSNNIHADKYSIKDFSIEGHVTLSTIHKAKGNEAYSVHVIGIDALYSLTPTIRERNLMFTAITRTKGWVSISGIALAAEKWVSELNAALKSCPDLNFTYPSITEMRLMNRDIKEKAIRKSKQVRILDELLTEMSPEEIKLFLAQREIKKGPKE